jgi:hypothetical protein
VPSELPSFCCPCFPANILLFMPGISKNARTLLCFPSSIGYLAAAIDVVPPCISLPGDIEPENACNKGFSLSFSANGLPKDRWGYILRMNTIFKFYIAAWFSGPFSISMVRNG